MGGKRLFWIVWLALTIALTSALTYAMLGGKRELFLIGKTTSAITRSSWPAIPAIPRPSAVAKCCRMPASIATAPS